MLLQNSMVQKCFSSKGTFYSHATSLCLILKDVFWVKKNFKVKELKEGKCQK